MNAAARLLDEAEWIDRDGDGIRDRDGQAFRFALNFYNTNTTRRNRAERRQASRRRAKWMRSLGCFSFFLYDEAEGTVVP